MAEIPEQTYEFTLILSGVTELTDATTDALFEAGCDDALPGVRDAVVFLDFSREAASFRAAVLSAIAEVEKAGIGAMVVRVEPDDLVTMSEIARRAGRSRESVRQLIAGRRGPGGFPPPVASLTGKSPIWRWADVAHWLAEGEKATSPAGALLDRGAQVATINALLEVRRHVPTLPEAIRLYDVLFQPRRSQQVGGRRGRARRSEVGADGAE